VGEALFRRAAGDLGEPRSGGRPADYPPALPAAGRARDGHAHRRLPRRRRDAGRLPPRRTRTKRRDRPSPPSHGRLLTTRPPTASVVADAVPGFCRGGVIAAVAD